MSLTEQEQSTLVAVARDGLEVAVTGRAPAVIPGEDAGALGQSLSCFITLYRRGELRGCIGLLEPTASLAEHARDMARGAALRDPRFPPVSSDELDEITLTVSVLSPPRPLTAPEDWELGRDGLIVSRGPRRGVLLPQVAADRGWDFPTFVSHTCVKAGLDPQAWQDPDTVVEVFSGTVYA